MNFFAVELDDDDIAAPQVLVGAAQAKDINARHKARVFE